MQRTLALIKPDATGKPWTEEYQRKVEVAEGEEAPEGAGVAWEVAGELRARDKREEVLARIAKEGFATVASKQVYLSKAEAEEFYAEHAGKPFFEGLTNFMCSGPTHALVLEKEDGIAAWRELMGPTNSLRARAASEEAHPLNEELWSLRALYGTDGTRNATHGSDSPFSAWREIGLLFPELDPPVWERSVALILPHALAAGQADAVVAALDAAEFVVVARARIPALPPALVESLLPPKYARAPEASAALEGECEAVLVEARGAVRRLRLLAGPAFSLAQPSHLHARFGTSDACPGVLAAASQAALDAFQPLFPASLPIEATLAVVKPGAADTHYRAILGDIAASGFTVLAETRRTLTLEQAEAFYAEHAGRPFFPALTQYMASGPVVALALAKPGAIRTWRILCGPTSTALAARDRPASLRARYGVDGTRNAVHGSDSTASAARELRFYFPTLPLATSGASLGGAAAIEYIRTKVVAEVYEPSRGHTVTKTVDSVLVDALAELAKAKPSAAPAEVIRWLGNWLIENNPRRGVVAAPGPIVEEPEEGGSSGGAGKLPPPRRSRALARGAPRPSLPPLALGSSSSSSSSSAAPPKRTIVFVLGAPGSGKGTQCARIAGEFGYAHLSMGDLLRAEAASGSPLGGELQAIMGRGELVSTALVLQILAGAMEASGASKFLLDGYPRALDQAVQFEAAFGAPSFVLSLQADEATLQARLLARGASSGRSDDNSQAISARLAVFREQSQAVITFYGKLGLLRSVSSLAPVEQVYGEVRPHFRPQCAWLLGGPGAGRSTMAARVAAMGLGWRHLSTGELCREEAARGTEEGQELAAMMARGDGVPLATVLRLVREAMGRSDPVGRYVLDGGVRDLEMAVAFEEAFGTPAFIVSLQAPDQVLLARSGTRGTTTAALTGRKDENLAVHRKQLADYHASTEPLIALYAAKALVRVVDADRPEAAVWGDVRAAFAPASVFVLGAPGSGKGTQCARVAAEYGYVHLSAGDLMRCEVERGSAAGAAISGYLAEGQLVPTATSLDLVKAAIAASRATRVLLDGFPRSLDQALAYQQAIVEPTFVLSFECSEEVCRARVAAAAAAGSSSSSSSAEAGFAARYRTFTEVTTPVLDHFGAGGLIKTVDASLPSAEAVYAAVRDLFRPAFVYVLGMPGTGKGTQCARLAQAYGYTHLSTGELMRAEVASGSDLGKGELAGAMAAGVLVDSALVQRLLAQAMAGSACRRFLLDGFPRSLEQAEAFEAAHGLPNFVLHFEAPVEALKARVAAAGKAAGGALRQDATEEAIAMRFEQYRSAEEAVVRAYDERRLVRSIGSLPPPDTVFARVRRLFQPPLVVLLRDAGCRHSELCARLGRELGYATLDVEALLAAEAASGSSHGKALAAAAAARRTPPTAPVLAVLEAAMRANPAAQRFLLDGYPRLVSAGFPGVHDQVMAAEERLGAFKGALVLSASYEARVARAGAKAPGELALVRARADAFRRERAPVAAFFDKLGKTCALDTTSASLEEMVESARPYLE